VLQNVTILLSPLSGHESPLTRVELGASAGRWSLSEVKQRNRRNSQFSGESVRCVAIFGPKVAQRNLHEKDSCTYAHTHVGQFFKLVFEPAGKNGA
jgi:hypothetical protein